MKAISAVSKMPTSELAQFAGKIAHCQQVIWGKSKRLTSGVKLADAMSRVAKLYRTGKATSSEMLQQPSPTPSPSPSPSPDACRAEEASASVAKAEQHMFAARQFWSNFDSPCGKATSAVVVESPMTIASTPEKDASEHAPMTIASTPEKDASEQAWKLPFTPPHHRKVMAFLL